jgi:hypothetical protein
LVRLVDVMTDEEADVPYGEDFHDPAAAAAWADAALRKRPWRVTIFEHFVSIVVSATVPSPRVLELGSGPGLLAEQVLSRCASVSLYTLVDFSEAMLEQSRRRLEHHAARAQFLRAELQDGDVAAAREGRVLLCTVVAGSARTATQAARPAAAELFEEEFRAAADRNSNRFAQSDLVRFT